MRDAMAASTVCDISPATCVRCRSSNYDRRQDPSNTDSKCCTSAWSTSRQRGALSYGHANAAANSAHAASARCTSWSCVTCVTCGDSCGGSTTSTPAKIEEGCLVTSARNSATCCVVHQRYGRHATTNRARTVEQPNEFNDDAVHHLLALSSVTARPSMNSCPTNTGVERNPSTA